MKPLLADSPPSLLKFTARQISLLALHTFSSHGNESSSGEGTGDENGNEDGNKDGIGEGRGEVKKRKKSHKN